jgi:hypothetical protein
MVGSYELVAAANPSVGGHVFKSLSRIVSLENRYIDLGD